MAHPDFEEFLVSLNEERVRYLIGGAHALAFHARPRATKDLDVFIDPSRANAERTVKAIGKFFGGSSPKFASAEHLRRYPNNPRHPNQAYRAAKTDALTPTTDLD